MKVLANDMGSPVSVEKSRLLSLIEFSQQSARLRGKPAATVAAHGLFALYEHEIQGLPGIHVDVNGPESEDEVWLAVGRLHETKPPEIASDVLLPWVQMTQSPTEEPELREVIDGASLIAAGAHGWPETPAEPGQACHRPEQTVTLSDYDKAVQVRAQFSNYLETRWRGWAREEKPRRKTIRLYTQLFTLKQQLEGSISETQVELVWGVGLGIWNCNGTAVSYPLVDGWSRCPLTPRQPRWRSVRAMLMPGLRLTGTPSSIILALPTWRKPRKSSSRTQRLPFRLSTGARSNRCCAQRPPPRRQRCLLADRSAGRRSDAAQAGRQAQSHRHVGALRAPSHQQPLYSGPGEAEKASRGSRSVPSGSSRRGDRPRHDQPGH